MKIAQIAFVFALSIGTGASGSIDSDPSIVNRQLGYGPLTAGGEAKVCFRASRQ
jgi:hypothetical protein